MKKVLVLSGDGINCERETARAFNRAGGDAEIVHVNRFLQNPEMLKDYCVLALPGGFSFGDEVRSGLVLARKMELLFKDRIEQFVKNNGLVIGICNGFQVLCQLGVFGEVTLAKNRQGVFIDTWVEVDCTKNDSPWFRGLAGKTLRLPIRHGEGRLLLGERPEFHSALRYLKDVNGSFEQNAGIVDKSGRILGLMPHPEAALDSWLHPFPENVNENCNLIKSIFENGVTHV